VDAKFYGDSSLVIMRRIFTIYLNAWQLVIKRRLLWFFLFIVNLLIAILLSIPFNGLLKSTVGDTTAFLNSNFHFDFVMIGDFLNNYGLGLRPVFQQSLVFMVVYYIIQVFFSGGILDTIIPLKDSEQNSFWKSCNRWFFDMFRISIYALLAQAVLLGLFLFFFIVLLGGISPFDIENEGNMIIIFKIVFPIYLFFVAMILCLRDYIKMKHIHGDRKWLFKTIPQTSAWLVRNLHLIMPLFLLHIISFLVCNYLYQWFKYLWTGEHGWMIFCLFLTIQLFVFIRIGIRLAHLTSVRLVNEFMGEKLRMT